MRLLMVSPEHFEVAYGINPHMRAADGSLKHVDRARAAAQWRDLLQTFRGIGIQVDVLPGAPGLPDMVFAANHGLPWQNEIILSRMAHAERREEVPLFRHWYEGQGYRIHDPFSDGAVDFEGMGDTLWLEPGRSLVGGHGFRTRPEVYQTLGRRFGFEVAPLKLVSDLFYHLDTCLCLLGPGAAAWVPQAFDAEGAAWIRARFQRLIEVDPREAKEGFAANAYCPDGRHVVVQRGCDRFVRDLSDAGFQTIEVETGEFIKAGGSVFCLKMALC
ncbi:MAG TPA: arginine deiminase-related protein [Bdellovibrionota bacterium]|nr:arginine deiminase-related protein [Bdellovibrionota bacterium]